jgi:GNAT superfamily N-acetyltransferase
MTADTELPVRKQLEAYNARDIDAFMRWWSEDCEYYEFPSRLLARGAAEVRARHVARFQEAHLLGSLIRRTVVGSLVVDHERVTRSFADGPGEVEVIAIYEVEEGRIRKAWFRTGPRETAPPLIREASAGDAEAIRNLVRAAYAKWVPVIGREPGPMVADYDRALREHAFALLFSGGALAGLIETVLRDDHLWVENLAVGPGFQGRGFGRQLLAHAEREAARAGRGEVRLLTNGAFEVNIALYGSLGYAVTHRAPFMGGTVVHMAKALG